MMREVPMIKAIQVPQDEKEYYRREIGTCMPLGTFEAYQDRDELVIDLEGQYLVKNPPFLTTVIYVEPPPPPPHQRRQVERLPLHIEEWINHIEALSGHDCICFVSEWNVLKADLEGTLPSSYLGQVIFRGTDEKVPVLMEWTRELVRDLDPSRKVLGFKGIWGFGTIGWIIPTESRHKMSAWAQLTQATESDVAEFFGTVKALFWVKYELDGILVLSHQYDETAIRRLLGFP